MKSLFVLWWWIYFLLIYSHVENFCKSSRSVVLTNQQAPPNPPLIKKMNHAYPPMTSGSRFSNETKVLRISIISFQDRTD